MSKSYQSSSPDAPLNDEGQAPACATDCPLATRRQFLRDAAVAVAGIAASMGIARTASALPISFTSAIGGSQQFKNYAIPAVDGAQIDRDAQVILVRWQNAVYAFNLSCPHQHTALRWEDGNHRFQCPKHHSKYQPDGEFIEGRATRNMDRLAISRQGANVVVDLDSMYRSDEDPKGWAAAMIRIA